MKDLVSILPQRWRIILIVLGLAIYATWLAADLQHHFEKEIDRIDTNFRRVDRNIERIAIDYWGCIDEKRVNAAQRIAICQTSEGDAINPACINELWPVISCPRTGLTIELSDK